MMTGLAKPYAGKALSLSVSIQIALPPRQDKQVVQASPLRVGGRLTWLPHLHALKQVQGVRCGFAGDRGFIRPELNEHAPRRREASQHAGGGQGLSSSRACEIGLTEQAGFAHPSTRHWIARSSDEPGQPSG